MYLVARSSPPWVVTGRPDLPGDGLSDAQPGSDGSIVTADAPGVDQ